MLEPPDVLYGEDLGSNYQGQETMLSKHFVEQTAGAGTPRQGLSSPSTDAA
jgi:2'-deoxycytidine 5'-triphosphate deaminase (DCD), C-terminal domain